MKHILQNPSFIFIFKVSLLIFFILLTIYLINIELKTMEETNKYITSNSDKPILLKSSNQATNKLFRNIFITGVPTLGAYYSIYATGTTKSLSYKERAELDSLRESSNSIKMLLESNETKSLLESAKYKANAAEATELNNSVLQTISKVDSLHKDIDTITALELKRDKGISLTPDEISMIAKKEAIGKDLSYYTGQMSADSTKLNSVLDNINKSSIFNFEFDYKKFIEELDVAEKLAFSGLLLNNLVLSNTISIILVIYGDYLIRRFDLENKYPKLAKLIVLRRKLQQYYLKLYFGWIFFGVLPQIFMNFYILYPKIVELFT